MALNFGMPFGFAEALALKYGIMKQQADAQTTSLNAAAGLDIAKTNVLPQQAAADIAETKARTTNLGLTGRTILPLAQAQIGLQDAQAGLYGSQTRLTDEDVKAKKQLTAKRPFGLGFGGQDDNTLGFGGYGFKF